jgi:sortase A
VTRRRRLAEDLSIEELRQLLIEKRRSERQKRMDQYRRTGRVILLDPVPTPRSMDSLISYPVDGESLLPGETVEKPLSRGKVWLDRLLVVIEVLAVLGLGYIIYNGVKVMRNLNSEVASALVQPTPSATPLISAVVLPSGHTPPKDGVTQFNEAEIPEHLRPLVQSLADIPLPTPSAQHAVNIKIPAINIFAPVVQGDGWEQLKKGVGQHVGTPNPGENGNIVLSAHNDVFGQLFRYLDQLKEGDEITLYTQQQAYTYVVRETTTVEPSQVDVMAPTRDAVVTLISCYPYMVDNKRIVVKAYLLTGQ